MAVNNRKQMDSILYLDGTSCHPTKCIDEIPRGLYFVLLKKTTYYMRQSEFECNTSQWFGFLYI